MSDTMFHEDLISVQLLCSRGGGRERELDEQKQTHLTQKLKWGKFRCVPASMGEHPPRSDGAVTA